MIFPNVFLHHTLNKKKRNSYENQLKYYILCTNRKRSYAVYMSASPRCLGKSTARICLNI